MTKEGSPAALLAAARSLCEPRWWGAGVGFLAQADGRADLCWVSIADGTELVVVGDVARVHPSGGGSWSVRGEAAVVVDRRGACWQVSGPGDGATAAVIRPADPGARVCSPALSPDGRWLLVVEDDQILCVTSVVDPDLVWRLTPPADFVFDPVWHPEGRAIVWHAWDVPYMAFDESRVEGATWSDDAGFGAVSVVVGGPDVAVSQPRLSSDGRHLGYLSDRGGYSGLATVELDGELRVGAARAEWSIAKEVGRSTWGPGQRSWVFAHDGPVVCLNEEGFGALVRIELGDHAPALLARAWWHGLDARGSQVIGVRTGARTPPELCVVDAASGQRRVLASSRDSSTPLDRNELVEPEVMWAAAGDGVEIPVRLYRPLPDRRVEALLVLIHGGPNGQRTVEWDPTIAYWVMRGFDVAVPDYRGSSGWGRDFAQAINGRWGEIDVADCAAVIGALTRERVAVPGRVVVMGSSSAGLTIAGLARRGSAVRPLLGGAIVNFGVCDLVALQESTYRFEAHYLHNLIGPWPEDRVEYISRSPVSWSGEIDLPLLVLQGATDYVVPPQSWRRLATTLMTAGVDVEYHEYPDEGHGWKRDATIRDTLHLSERFVDRILATR